MEKYKIIDENDSLDIWADLVLNKFNFIAQRQNLQYKVYTSDGSEFIVDNITDFLNSYNLKKWFKTLEISSKDIILSDEDNFILSNYPRHEKYPYFFGSFAIRKGSGFITTKRGKTENNLDFTYVDSVDINNLIVLSKDKATLNAPLLYEYFNKNPKICYLIHGHKMIGTQLATEYEFPGTLEELNFVPINQNNFIINLPYHGYLAGFSNFEDCKNFLIYEKNSEINWQNYHQDFPLRYINPSTFDQAMKSIDYSVFNNVLDIGGGVYGTQILKKASSVDCLDPFIDKPDWQKEKVNFNTNHKYDLIVARGSFNYLSEIDILKLNEISSNNGMIMLNTFKNPPLNDWVQRPFESLNGKGQESYRLNHNLVEHILEYDNGIKMAHFFYYYSIEKIRDMLKGFSLEITESGSNSLIIKGTKNE